MGVTAMAKKKSSGGRKNRQSLPENALPQNILPMGERVEEGKNIYLSQKVYRQIHKFTRNKLTNESGGVLVGTTIEEFGKINILVSGFIEAKYCEATPTTLKFTHATWDYIHQEMDKRFPGMKIMGWIHTHPDFGIFLSDYDKFIHENFFSEENQIAYVVDPIRKEEGLYFWINGRLVRCKGFYIFDRTGVKIDISSDPEEESSGKERLLSVRNILLAVLTGAVVFLLFGNLSLRSEIDRLQLQQETIVATANQSLGYLQQQIQALQTRVGELEQIIQELKSGEEAPATENGNGGQTTGTEETNE
jgi:proteasome lid subunit RPN8/RPN11